MKKVLSIALVVCLVASLFAGCSALTTGINESKIVGTWEGEKDTGLFGMSVDLTYTFGEDGTGEMPLLDSFVNMNVDFTYTIEEDVLTINVDSNLYSGTFVYTMVFEGDNLILTDVDGETLTLTKVG